MSVDCMGSVDLASMAGQQVPINDSSLTTQLVTSSTRLDGPLDANIPGYPVTMSASKQVSVDFNGDGYQDILWRNRATGENSIWFMKNASLSSWLILPPATDLNWYIQGTGDFTGDGKTDILWRNYATGQNTVWVMDRTTYSTWALLAPATDLNWRVQGIDDFTGDGKTDILWRNEITGQNSIWVMNGTTYSTFVWLPSVAGSNLQMQATGDFNRDGSSDIVWRNYLSGENFVWLMNGTSVSTTWSLAKATDLNWQIGGAGDFDSNGSVDLLWRNVATGDNSIWFMDGLTYSQYTFIPAATDLNWQIGLRHSPPSHRAIALTNLTFSGREGDAGTVWVQLTQAPQGAVTLTLAGENFVVVDTDADSRNGSQSTLTFTPADWYVPRRVSFIAEVDGSSGDRLMGNTVRAVLQGALSESTVYDLGSTVNTYAPDPTRFNIDLDFRNDYAGLWTPARRAIAQQAANDWSRAIANEWEDFSLNATLGRLEIGSGRPYSFTTQRYVDDLLVFVNLYQGSGGSEPAVGGPDYDFGGWVNSLATYGPMPRVGQLAINPIVFTSYSDMVLYQIVLHELGHVLGLLGLNWTGYSLYNQQTATFQGEYSRLANNGQYIPLQTQDGGDQWHPANSVRSIMSYAWTYSLTGPTPVDYAMLADSGYRIYGVNVPTSV